MTSVGTPNHREPKAPPALLPQAAKPREPEINECFLRDARPNVLNPPRLGSIRGFIRGN